MRALSVIALATLAACAPAPTVEPPPSRALVISESLPPMRSFTVAPAPPPTRSNSDMASDFLDLAFRMESGRAVPVMTRFEEPISVRVTGNAPPSLTPDLRDLLSRMRNEAGIDIFVTGAPQASITIEAVPREALQRAVPRAACFVVPRVSSWGEFLAARRSPQVDWTTLTRRDRAAIFVPADVSPQEVRDCLHEELAQAIGPLNDLYRLPDSVFNDDNIHAVLTGFDMLMLKVYYSPQLRNGMSRGEVAARLPGILAGLNPTGQRAPDRQINDTSRDWIEAMETALSPGGSGLRRRQAAERAINLARAFGWTGARPGFAFYAYGRLQLGNDADIALQSFREASRAFRASPETRLHEAHVSVQLAAFALAAGDAERTLELTDWAIPVAMQYQNASLLATLMMFKAEALELSGRGGEAEALRLDSLGWARYGFGSDRNVRARADEIAALNPRAPS
ncbi:DUF2927 domain-containing protein [Flavimaricola marinus]|uniref:ATP-dependent transcriptional regulator n=1 Tax=Flavimaricola marinus TaxID=1819565 RepID=A0A238LJ68_9RHOB|nr:DUF2927 domain-containing protein [Flavimaricola marinus]SMY09662.1 hypothetical protein LOM8899_03834 [Flavimaricola marinus]